MRAAAILLPAVIAVALAAAGTRHGVGLTDDSLAYLASAASLARGEGHVATSPCEGVARPITHWPPLYPWVLSLGVRAGITAAEAARLVQLALFAANVALVGLIVLRRTRSPAAAGLAGLFAATSLVMLEIHTAAWSESVFLLLGLAGLAGIGAALERPAWPALIAGSLALGAAALTRYTGVATIAAAGLGLLVLGSRPARVRLVQAAVAGAVALAPFALWLAHNVAETGSPTDRGFALREGIAGRVAHLFVTVGGWLAPGADRLTLVPRQELVVGVAGALAVLAFVALARAGALESLLRLHALVYAALLVVAMATVSASIPADPRLLAPVFLSVLVVTAVAAHRRWAAAGRRARRGLAAALAVLLVVYAGAAAAATRHLWRNGRGYQAPRWDLDAVAPALARLPDEARVHTNYLPAVLLRVARRVCPFDRERALADGDRAVILFYDLGRGFAPAGAAARRGDLAEAREVAAALGLRELRAGPVVLFARDL